MRIVRLPKSFYYVSKNRPIELSHIGHQRLEWLKVWKRLRQEGYCAGQAADIIRIPRATLYRWQKRLDERGLIGLEDRDRRPKHVRKPQWSPELAESRSEDAGSQSLDGQREALEAPAERWNTDIDFHSWPHPEALESPWGAPRAAQKWDMQAQTTCQTSLRHQEAPGLPGEETGGPGSA